MKKIFKLILTTLLMMLILPIGTLAENDNSLYAYTEVDSVIEEYAKDKVGVFMDSHYEGNDVSNYRLGQGIKIYSNFDDEKMLFPIWDGSNVIATFLVGKDGGEIYAVYSEAYIGQLNYLLNETSEASPLSIMANEEGIYGTVNNKWFDLNLPSGTYIERQTYIPASYLIKNVAETLEISLYIKPRIPTSYSRTFNIYQAQGTSGLYCYSYALGNILMNMGYSSYTPANIQSYTGCAQSASKTTLANYLKSKGLKCNYSNSGYLSFSDVTNIIYNKGYIYMSAKSNSRDVSHAFVIYGDVNDGTNKLYNFWNPWYSYKQTMNASNRVISTHSSETFTWNNGYIYNIRWIWKKVL